MAVLHPNGDECRILFHPIQMSGPFHVVVQIDRRHIAAVLQRDTNAICGIVGTRQLGWQEQPHVVALHRTDEGECRPCIAGRLVEDGPTRLKVTSSFRPVDHAERHRVLDAPTRIHELALH